MSVDNAAAAGSGNPAQAPQTPEKGTPEYNAMMAERYDKANAIPPDAAADVPPMPDGGLEKFYDKGTGAYDWANHVKELNYRLEQVKSPPKKVADQRQDEKSSSDDATKKAVENVGLDWDDLQARFVNDGKLSDGDYDALEKAGIPRAVVDNYVQAIELAQMAAREVAQQQTYEYAGGEAVLNGVLMRAAKELPAEEIDHYNKILASPNWRIAVDALKARFGGEPSLIAGGTPSGVGEGAFASRAEMTKAMRDPRYKPNSPEYDPAYRMSVIRRVAASKL